MIIVLALLLACSSGTRGNRCHDNMTCDQGLYCVHETEDDFVTHGTNFGRFNPGQPRIVSVCMAGVHYNRVTADPTARVSDAGTAR